MIRYIYLTEISKGKAAAIGAGLGAVLGGGLYFGGKLYKMHQALKQQELDDEAAEKEMKSALKAKSISSAFKKLVSGLSKETETMDPRKYYGKDTDIYLDAMGRGISQNIKTGEHDSPDMLFAKAILDRRKPEIAASTVAGAGIGGAAGYLIGKNKKGKNKK